MTDEEIERTVARVMAKFEEAEELGRAFFATTNRIANALEAIRAELGGSAFRPSVEPTREPEHEHDRSALEYLFTVVGAYLEALGPCSDAEPDEVYCEAVSLDYDNDQSGCRYCALAYAHQRIITIAEEAKR